MSDFARIERIDDSQVLLYRDTDDEGDPVIKTVMEIDGVTIIFMGSYGPAQADESWDKRDQVFADEDAIRRIAVSAHAAATGMVSKYVDPARESDC